MTPTITNPTQTHALPKLSKNIYKNKKQLNKERRIQLSGGVDQGTFTSIDIIRAEWQEIAAKCGVFRDISRMLVVDYAVAFFKEAWEKNKNNTEFLQKWIPIDKYDLADRQ